MIGACTFCRVRPADEGVKICAVCREKVKRGGAVGRRHREANRKRNEAQTCSKSPRV